MTREELIAYDKWLTRRKWGTGEIISPERAADLYLAKHPLPPAEGAEEIDDETIAWAAEHQCGTPFSERWIGFVKGAKWHRSLHAQRIAEKMVEEGLREELIAYEQWMFGQDNAKVTTSYIKEYIDEYLKARSHD
jgi:enoyl-CoA hydratase/carnithine racemase